MRAARQHPKTALQQAADDGDDGYAVGHNIDVFVPSTEWCDHGEDGDKAFWDSSA